MPRVGSRIVSRAERAIKELEEEKPNPTAAACRNTSGDASFFAIEGTMVSSRSDVLSELEANTRGTQRATIGRRADRLRAGPRNYRSAGESTGVTILVAMS